MQWKFIRGFNRSHRYFRDEDNRLALADDSGRTPDQTDDGVLYVDKLRQIDYDGMFSVPIINQKGMENTTPATEEEAIWLHGVCHFYMTPTAFAKASEIVWEKVMKTMFT